MGGSGLSAFSWNLPSTLVASSTALLGIGEVAIPVTGLTAYSEVEGAVRVSLTVSIHVQMIVLLFLQ